MQLENPDSDSNYLDQRTESKLTNEGWNLGLI